MPGRRVALLCIDPWEDVGEFHPFNYAIRRVQAALIARGFETELVESRSTDIEPFLERIAEMEPDVVGASAYVWSFPTFVEIARRLKASRPEVAVVFGGPSARSAMFDLQPYRDLRWNVDAMVTGEGEEAFLQILSLPSLDPDSLGSVPGVEVPSRDGWRRRLPPASIIDLDSLPSPYALDLVPPDFSAHLETFRGCPLSCSFCQWGDGAGDSRIFSTERLVEELEHIRRLQISNVVLVDAGLNLNARAFRALSEAQRRTGALRDAALGFEVYPSHLKEEHLEFLADIRINSIGLGLQSYEPAVLKRLNRSFDIDRFERVARELAKLDGHVVVEIIMALPGDDPESFRRTLAKARELPCDVRVFHCLVLPDALMTRAPPWAAMDFDPLSLRMRSCAGWSVRDVSAMRDELSRMCADADGWDQGSFWHFPQEHRRGLSGPNADRSLASRATGPAETAGDPEFTSAAMAAVARASGGRWSVRRTEQDGANCSLTLDAEGTTLVVDLAQATPDKPSFTVEDGVAISYRQVPAPPAAAQLEMLRQLAPTLALLHRTAARGGGRRGPPLPLVSS